MPDVEAYSPETERDKSVQETLASQPYVYAFESADARRKFLCGVPLLKRHTLSKDTGYFGEPTANSAANPSKKVGYFGEPLAIPSVSLVDTYAQQVHSSKNTRGGGLRISDAGISELTELQHRAGWEEQNGKMVVCWKINQANFDFIEEILGTDGVAHENKESLPAEGKRLAAVDDLILAPMNQDKFMPNVISMSPSIRDNIACSMKLNQADKDAMQEAEGRNDTAKIRELKKKAQRAFTGKLNAMGYHIRAGTGLNTQLRKPDADIQYILCLYNWNTHAKSSSCNGNGRKKLGGGGQKRKSRAKSRGKN